MAHRSTPRQTDLNIGSPQSYVTLDDFGSPV